MSGHCWHAESENGVPGTRKKFLMGHGEAVHCLHAVPMVEKAPGPHGTHTLLLSSNPASQLHAGTPFGMSLTVQWVPMYVQRGMMGQSVHDSSAVWRREHSCLVWPGRHILVLHWVHCDAPAAE